MNIYTIIIIKLIAVQILMHAKCIKTLSPVVIQSLNLCLHFYLQFLAIFFSLPTYKYE